MGESREYRWPSATLIVVLVVLFIVVYVLPIPREHPRSDSVNALSDVKNAETAFTGMLSDAQVGSFSDFFEPEAFATVHSRVMEAHSLDAFEAAVRMYSNAFYGLLQDGKNVNLGGADTDGMHDVLRMDVVQKLGTNYMEIDDDPWGNTYRIFAGPWPSTLGPPVLRIRSLVDKDASHEHEPDALTGALGNGEKQGYPAPNDLPIYIWSLGQNGLPDHAIFDPSGAYPAPPQRHYRADAEPEYIGGGDDINNWDTGQSWIELYPKRNASYGCSRY